MEWLNMDCCVREGVGDARAVSGEGSGATYDKARSNSILAAECRASSSTSKASPPFPSSPSSSCVVVVVVVVVVVAVDDDGGGDGEVDDEGARWLQN